MRLIAAAILAAGAMIAGAIAWHGREVAVPLQQGEYAWHDRWTGDVEVCTTRLERSGPRDFDGEFVRRCTQYLGGR